MDRTARYKMYLDYVNNFLTVACFARHYGVSEAEGKNIIDEFSENDGGRK